MHVLNSLLGHNVSCKLYLDVKRLQALYYFFFLILASHHSFMPPNSSFCV